LTPILYPAKHASRQWVDSREERERKNNRRATAPFIALRSRSDHLPEQERRIESRYRLRQRSVLHVQSPQYRFIGTGGLRQTLQVLSVALLRVPSHNRLHRRIGFQEPAVDALHQLHRYGTELVKFEGQSRACRKNSLLQAQTEFLLTAL